MAKPTIKEIRNDILDEVEFLQDTLPATHITWKPAILFILTVVRGIIRFQNLLSLQLENTEQAAVNSVALQKQIVEELKKLNEKV